MKKMTRIILLVLVAASLFTSCHKSGSKQTKYIPKDAYVVFKVNNKSILEKISKANISFDSLEKVFSDGPNDTSIKQAANKWEDIKNSGIDLEQEMYGFVKTGGSIMTGQNYSTGFVFSLKDASSFETFLKKENPDKEIKKGDNYSYLALGDDYIAGWNDDVAIIAVKHAGSSSPGTYATGEGTLTQQMLTSLFAQKESESIASADGFSDMQKETTDMAFFLNSANGPSSSVVDMTKFSDLIKGAYSIGTADFEDGTVKCTFKAHTSQAMADLAKKYPYRAIDVNMLDRYPSQIEGFMIMSFDPQLIPAILKYSGFDVLANQGLQRFGVNFTLDDVFKAFKGDFALIGSDFGLETKTVSSYGNYKLPQPVTTQVPTYKLLVNTTIADKASYDKIVTELAAKNIMTLQNGQYVFPQMGDFAMKATDKNLYVASAADLLQQYEAGAGKNNMPADIHDKIKGKVGAFYLDINKILQVIPVTTPDMQAGMDAAKATFKDVIATADNFDGNASSGNMEFRFMDDKQNSIASIIKFAIAEKKLARKSKDAYELSPADSTAIPPPPPPSK